MDPDRWAEKRQRFSERVDARMERRCHRSPVSGLVMGGVIVAIGVVLLLDNMGLISAHEVWRFWPLILVAIGLARMLEARPAAMIWGAFIAGIGTLLFLRNFDVLRVNFNLIWPVAVIAFGATMLWKALDRRRGSDQAATTGDSDVHLFAIFSGGRRRIDSKEFRGCDILAIFGGFHIDLTNAAIPPGEKAVIDINAIFGGVEIEIPENWNVTMTGVGICGGFEDKTRPPKTIDAPAQELVITGSTIFGGASIRS